MTPSDETLREHLDQLATLRAEFTDLPTTKLAAILRHLSPEDAERVAAIAREFDEREAALKAEIAQREASIKELVLLTRATATGTYLQAVIVAPRVTWDTKALQVYSALHPEILPYRKVGEPSVTIRARGLRKA
jgi:hypothetical protein